MSSRGALPGSGLGSWFSSSPPTVALDISARRVTAVSAGRPGSGDGRLTLAAHATERLPDGLVKPSLTSPNIADVPQLTAAIARVLGEVGTQTGTHPTRRVALALPDGTAKVSLVRFDKVPERREDLAELVRWQVKKAVPFPIEQAQVAWTQAGTDAAGATEFLVVIARRDIVEEYESACTGAGAHAGLADLASCHLINLVLAGDPSLATPAREADKQDWLLVHVASDSTTTAVMRGPDVILFRNRPAEGDESLADHVHQTTMYYEDRLRGERLSCVMVAAQDVEAPTIAELNELCRGLEARGGVRVMAIDVRTAATLADRIAPSQEWLQAVAAPVGALVRAFAA